MAPDRFQRLRVDGWRLRNALSARTLDALSGHIAILDEHGTVTVVNAAWRRFARRHGLRMPRFGVGANYLEISRKAATQGDAAAEAALAGIAQVVANERQFFRMEYPCFGPTERFWFLLLVSSFRLLGRRYVVVAHENITEQKQAEEAARDSERNFRRLLEALPDPLILVNGQGTIVQVNRQTEQVFGYERTELEGQSLGLLMPDRVRARHLDQFRAYLAAPRERPMGAGLDLFGRRKDGTEFPVAVMLSPIETSEGLLIIAAVRDISRLKQAIEEAAHRTAEFEALRETNRLKDHFLSTISHEMKTPLSLITGYAELLEDVCTQPELLEGIQEGSRRLAEHVNSMLDYSALLSGSLPIERTEVDVHEVVSRAVGEMAPTFERKGVRLVAETSECLLLVQGDLRRLVQIVTELLDNARKFTPAGGEAGVRCCADGQQVRIEVWDSGEGISAEDRRRIWGAFSQLDIGDAARKGGLGLGLTLVKKLTELHGGRVELESEPGGGSRFSVLLPRVAG